MLVPFAEEKMSGWRDTCITSSNRVTDQNPGPGAGIPGISGSGLKATGTVSRARRK